MGNTLSTVQQSNAIYDYHCGLSMRDLAAKYGVCRQAVRKILIANNLVIHPPHIHRSTVPLVHRRSCNRYVKCLVCQIYVPENQWDKHVKGEKIHGNQDGTD